MVSKDTVPATSSVWSRHQPGDCLDCCSVASTLSSRQGAERGLRLPPGAAALLALRNRVVRPFGLKIGDGSGPVFPVCHESEDEVILRTDDRHLDFRIGVIRHRDRLYLSRWVRPHNFWGRA